MLGAERGSHSPSLGVPYSWCPINASVSPTGSSLARKGPLSSLSLTFLPGQRTKVINLGWDTGCPAFYQPTMQTIICCPLVDMEGTVATWLPLGQRLPCPANPRTAKSGGPDLPTVWS